MDIHFISSLTPDDEDRLAPALLAALKPILELMPIAYTVRIRTANNTVYQQTRTEMELPQQLVALDDLSPPN